MTPLILTPPLTQWRWDLLNKPLSDIHFRNRCLLAVRYKGNKEQEGIVYSSREDGKTVVCWKLEKNGPNGAYLYGMPVQASANSLTVIEMYDRYHMLSNLVRISSDKTAKAAIFLRDIASSIPFVFPEGTIKESIAIFYRLGIISMARDGQNTTLITKRLYRFNALPLTSKTQDETVAELTVPKVLRDGTVAEPDGLLPPDTPCKPRPGPASLYYPDISTEAIRSGIGGFYEERRIPGSEMKPNRGLHEDIPVRVLPGRTRKKKYQINQ